MSARMYDACALLVSVALTAGAAWHDVNEGRFPMGAVGYVVAFATAFFLVRCDR